MNVGHVCASSVNVRVISYELTRRGLGTTRVFWAPRDWIRIPALNKRSFTNPVRYRASHTELSYLTAANAASV